MFRSKALSVLLAGLVVLGSAPAFAQSERAREAERRQQAQILESAGGAYDGPQGAYVARVGERAAAAAGLPGRCTFTVVNSETVNAFTAPPGCYIYVTRGLLAIMNSEAELAGVLGHELGHVTANHAGKQRNAEVGAGLAAMIVGAVAKSDQAGRLAGQVAKLGTLSYSRNQEYEADSLGLRYLAASGYATQGLTRVLEGLQREDQYSARGGAAPTDAVPVWARTHPLTTDRIRRVAQQAGRQVTFGDPVTGVAPYLTAMDGLTYGPDLDQGVIVGQSFIHPSLRVAFEAPEGFRLVNGQRAVRIEGAGGLRAEFSMATLDGELEDRASRTLREIIGQAQVQWGQPTSTRINGLDAVILPSRARSQGNPVDLVAVAYGAGGGRAYQFVSMAPAGRGRVFDTLYGSLRRLSEREAALLSGQKIELLTVRGGDTIEKLAQRMSVREKLPLFLMLNALDPGQPLEPGRKVKVITGDPR
jgi:predicted Zn-dependent protease